MQAPCNLGPKLLNMQESLSLQATQHYIRKRLQPYREYVFDQLLNVQVTPPIYLSTLLSNKAINHVICFQNSFNN